MGTIVDGEQRVCIMPAEMAERHAVTLGTRPQLLVILVPCRSRHAPVVVVRPLHWHTQEQGLCPELAQAAQQQLELIPVHLLPQPTGERSTGVAVPLPHQVLSVPG